MWLNWVEMIAVAALCTLCSKYYVHMLQLESYQLDGYLRWANKNRNKLLGWTLNVGVVFTVAYYGLNLLLGASSPKKSPWSLPPGSNGCMWPWALCLWRARRY